MSDATWKLAQQVLLSRAYAALSEDKSNSVDWLESERAAIAATFADDDDNPDYDQAHKEADEILLGAIRIINIGKST